MISGYALHSGVQCTVHLHPDEGPVRFRRGPTTLPAHADYVVATNRSTTLGRDAARVTLVEHLLAVLHATGWWRNLVIEVSADELPILDGSGLPWLEAISALGPPPPPPEALALETPVSLTVNGSCLSATPENPSLAVSIDFEHPSIGSQTWRGGPEAYAGLLDARTFGFLKDVDALRELGLAARASLENAIVFDDTGPLAPLRSPDEPVRHKALDALGDLFLLGQPLEAKLIISKGSHASHLAFVRHLLTLNL